MKKVSVSWRFWITAVLLFVLIFSVTTYFSYNEGNPAIDQNPTWGFPLIYYYVPVMLPCEGGSCGILDVSNLLLNSVIYLILSFFFAYIFSRKNTKG
jgi:hypothetical protein